MWSRLNLRTGILLTALFLMAIYSPAAATPTPGQDCCPYHHWCCVQTTTLDPCALIFPDCQRNPYDKCCRRHGLNVASLQSASVRFDAEIVREESPCFFNNTRLKSQTPVRCDGRSSDGAPVAPQGLPRRGVLRRGTQKEAQHRQLHHHAQFDVRASVGDHGGGPRTTLQVTVLAQLCRKVPVLRVCFGWRDDQLWLREMDECKVDFKVLKDDALDKHRAGIMQRFDTERGPLWRVALVPEHEEAERDPHEHSPGEANPTHSATWARPLNELPRPFAYNYSVLFCIHHGIADGMTITRICGFLRAILDDLLSGRPVDATEQLGEHVAYDTAMALYAAEEQKLKDDPSLLAKAMKEFAEGERTRPLLLDVLPRPQGGEATTGSIPLRLSEDETKGLVSCCKKMKVSLNSYFTTAINVALIDFLEDMGVRKDAYEFRAGHDINLRRYYGGDTSRTLGVHLPTFGFRFVYRTAGDLYREFWASTRAFHKRFHDALLNGEPLRAVVLRQRDASQFDDIKGFYSDQGEPNYYYTISNLADVTEALSKKGDNVQITQMDRYVALRNKKCFMCFSIHTFRDQVTVNMLYSTHYFSEEYAIRLADLVHSNIISRIALGEKQA
ncbi:uncharacterized protein LOC134770471 isoform X1 [Penaeus indicus]|uniref:uncharacterized protein LOC134770471 isoform X1 n=1 Tax=Penaeus indicus TaxID=29960 RepID=UPI00300DB66A